MSWSSFSTKVMADVRNRLSRLLRYLAAWLAIPDAARRSAAGPASDEVSSLLSSKRGWCQVNNLSLGRDDAQDSAARGGAFTGFNFDRPGLDATGRRGR